MGAIQIRGHESSARGEVRISNKRKLGFAHVYEAKYEGSTLANCVIVIGNPKAKRKDSGSRNAKTKNGC